MAKNFTFIRYKSKLGNCSSKHFKGFDLCYPDKKMASVKSIKSSCLRCFRPYRKSITAYKLLSSRAYNRFSALFFRACTIKDTTDVSVVNVTATYTEGECVTVIL